MLKNNLKILIPNSFTGLSMVIGLISIFYSVKASYIDAAWLVLLCTIMDKLDGAAARLFHVSSGFGIEFDSFSDFISFCCAPAILVFSYFNFRLNSSKLIGGDFYLVVAVVLYVVFGAVRLAKYNSLQASDKDYFYGLTTTVSGGLLALYMIFAIEHPNFPILLSTDLVAGMIIAQSLLLLVPFKYPKIKMPKNKFIKVVSILFVMFCCCLVLVRKLPWFIYLASVSYVVVGALKTREAAHLFLEDAVKNESSESNNNK